MYISIGIIILIICGKFLLVCPQIYESIEVIKDSFFEFEKINSTSLRIILTDSGNEEVYRQGRVKDGYYYAHLKYRLNLAEVIHLKPLNCNDKGKKVQVYVSKDLDRDIASCKQKVDRFDKADILHGYCDWNEAFMNVTAMENSVVISNLLPALPYYFFMNYYFHEKGSEPIPIGEEKFDKICMDEGIPSYPPQTDLGSFRVSTKQQRGTRKNRDYPNDERVELYWRTVPHLLAGSENLSYQVSCSSTDEKNVTFDGMINDITTGTLDFPIGLLANCSYKCALRSKNRLGYSLNYSEIVIPKPENVIDLDGKFRFYVAEVSNGEYFSRWTDVDSLLSGRESLNSSSRGNYTVYWCTIRSSSLGCTDIEGFEITNENFLTLLLEGDGKPQNRILGISYKSYDGKSFTGIIWAECIATMRTQAQNANEPIEIYKALGSPGNHSTINISWSYRGCRSIIVLAEKFDIEYCSIKQVDPCSPIAAKSLDDSELINYDFTNKKVCREDKVINRLETEIVLKNLSASTMYAIRIKHQLPNGTYNQWSNPVYAITLAEPKKAKECSARTKIFFEALILVLTFSVFIVVICMFIKRMFFHYWSLASQIRKVETQLPQKIDEKLNKKNDEEENEFIDIGMKFWSNRFPDKQSIRGLPIANSESSLDGDGDNCDGRDSLTDVSPPPFVADYIPNRLMIGYVEQSPATKVTELTDDNQKDTISVGDNSVGSQESFLKTIAEEQVKKTDWQTQNSVL